MLSATAYTLRQKARLAVSLALCAVAVMVARQASDAHAASYGVCAAALSAMAADGYAYAIIAGVGPIDFYKKAVNAIEIPKSSPGIYRGMLS